MVKNPFCLSLTYRLMSCHMNYNNKILIKMLIFRLFVALLCIAIFGCTPKELPTVYHITPEIVMVKLSHETDKSTILMIKDSLEKLNIDMDDSGTSYYENARIKNLVLTITTENGNTGRLSADAVNLQFKYYGFIIDKNSGRFKVGEMMDEK